jgi:hypothetical protein
MFTVEPLVTKDLLLRKYPEEQYMSYYLGVAVNKRLFKSPLRVDHRETCSFYKSEKSGLRYKDFGNGVNYNFIDVVMYKYSCGFSKALQIIASDFHIIDSNIQKKAIPEYHGPVLATNEPCDIKVEIKDFTPKELSWWKNFGITEGLLQEGRVYSLKTVFLNNEPAYFSSDKCPMYGYFLGHDPSDERELWKIYFPTKLKYRFLLNNSKLQGVHMLPKKGNLLIITKSMKDVLTLKGLGYTAIAPQSENSYPKKEQVEALEKRFDKILVFLDNDRAGLKAMASLRKMYRLLYYAIPYIHKVKDISDFYKKHGETKTKTLIDELATDIDNGRLDYHYTKHDLFKNRIKKN